VQDFARTLATTAAAITVSLTPMAAAAASPAAGPAAGPNGREFSVAATRDFSVTAVWGSRPTCLVAPRSSIFVADTAQPAATCR
jgi:hypothetical protein